LFFNRRQFTLLPHSTPFRVPRTRTLVIKPSPVGSPALSSTVRSRAPPRWIFPRPLSCLPQSIQSKLNHKLHTARLNDTTTTRSGPRLRCCLCPPCRTSPKPVKLLSRTDVFIISIEETSFRFFFVPGLLGTLPSATGALAPPLSLSIGHYGTPRPHAGPFRFVYHFAVILVLDRSRGLAYDFHPHAHGCCILHTLHSFPLALFSWSWQAGLERDRGGRALRAPENVTLQPTSSKLQSPCLVHYSQFLLPNTALSHSLVSGFSFPFTPVPLRVSPDLHEVLSVLGIDPAIDACSKLCCCCSVLTFTPNSIIFLHLSLFLFPFSIASFLAHFFFCCYLFIQYLYP
jgi:hypothetical protein